MSSLYFGLAVFCQFEDKVPEFDTVFSVQCTLYGERGSCQILGPLSQTGRIQWAQNIMTTSLSWSHNTSHLCLFPLSPLTHTHPYWFVIPVLQLTTQPVSVRFTIPSPPPQFNIFPADHCYILWLPSSQFKNSSVYFPISVFSWPFSSYRKTLLIAPPTHQNTLSFILFNIPIPLFVTFVNLFTTKAVLTAWVVMILCSLFIHIHGFCARSIIKVFARLRRWKAWEDFIFGLEVFTSKSLSAWVPYLSRLPLLSPAKRKLFVALENKQGFTPLPPPDSPLNHDLLETW